MSTVNRVPLGLLSLLDTQSQGVVPDEIGRSVTAGFDMGALWFNARGLEGIQASSAVQLTSGQANVAVNVPEGELWAVVSASARGYATDAAATSHRVDLTFQPNQASLVNSFTLAAGVITAISIGGIATSVWNFSGSQPLYARAGSRFGAYMTVPVPLALGTLVEVAVLFYRLKI